LILIQEVFENCTTFDEAVYLLTSSDLTCSAFFLVTGTKKEESCVIERTPSDFSILNPKNGIISKANHFESKKFLHLNKYLDDKIQQQDPEMESFLVSSEERQQLMRKLLKETTGKDEYTYAGILDVEPILNEDSHQQMLFNAKKGIVLGWRG